MREWAQKNGKCVRQRAIRQRTIKYKHGTLPLNMYHKKTTLPPRVDIGVSTVEDEGEETPVIEDQICEYDSDSELSDMGEDDEEVECLNIPVTHWGRSMIVPARYR